MSWMSDHILEAIRDTLDWFKLADVIVSAKVGIVRCEDGLEVRRCDVIKEIELSTLAAISSSLSGRAFQQLADGEIEGKTLYIYEKHSCIGSIIERDEGVVFLNGEKNSLKDCLGWLIATSYGRDSVFRAYKLDNKISELRPLLLQEDLLEKDLDALIMSEIGQSIDPNEEVVKSAFVKVVEKDGMSYTLGPSIPLSPTKQMLCAAAKHNLEPRKPVKRWKGVR